MKGKVKKENKFQEPLLEGRIIRNTGSSYLVLTNDGMEYSCKVKGNFRIKGIRTTNPVAVGDIVYIFKATDDVYYINNIAPRKNYIIRRASNLSKESHILAANIDQAILVASLYNPATPTTFIDRFLATAEAYSIPAAVVLNKEDLWSREGRDYALELKEIYNDAGYSLFTVSAISREGLDELRKFTTGKITLLAGNSGVGKSSLINALVPGINLKTGEISDIHHTGTHTTTFSEMIFLPEGGALIDIPGVKGFGTIEFEKNQVSHYFPEIFKASERCKYGDCCHIGEPGCAVIEALENGGISPSRYNSYLSIIEEVSKEKDENKYRKPF